MHYADNAAFEEACKAFIERTCKKTAGNLYGLMKPRFLDCCWEERSLTMCFPAMEWELNAGGAMHGGITVSMIDSVMGSLTHILCGKLTPTIQLNTCFLRGGPASGDVVVKAKATRVGRTIIYLSAEVWIAGRPDKLIATSTASYRNYGEGESE